MLNKNVLTTNNKFVCSFNPSCIIEMVDPTNTTQKDGNGTILTINSIVKSVTPTVCPPKAVAMGMIPCTPVITPKTWANPSLVQDVNGAKVLTMSSSVVCRSGGILKPI